jgi:hypothetical protein
MTPKVERRMSLVNLGSVKEGYELVFTVQDYCDGPRRGIANYHGEPYVFDCIFDEDGDSYSDSYILTPISRDALRVALEAWDIFKRWRMAFDSGRTNRETHPALPEDKTRYERAMSILNEELNNNKSSATKLRGEFEVLGEQAVQLGALTHWQVRWSTQ